MQNKLAPHETLDLHELLSLKTSCLTKATAMSSLATDSQLKGILSHDMSNARQHIQQLQSILRTGL